ncbi:UNVERIFIED_CONTAM: hypothetical protein Sradi_3001600 [Sesamum radiatum]|uniref:Uncharacterized protein n=1 Tax=Sesamum radiatum TaxID=300843 RepID=A0AAW2S354_SESRA
MDDGDAQDTNLKPSTGASKVKHVSFTDVVSIVNPDHDCGNRLHSETNPKGIRHGSAQISNSSNAVFSPLSKSSSDDPVLLKFRVQNNIPKPKSLYKIDKLDLSSEALKNLEESITGSQESTSQCSDITHESACCVSPTLSPPIQVMERGGGLDPGRIPDHIFSGPLSTPTDWSAASSDSLFSIRIGNTSFARDYAPRMGADFCKSGELPKSGEASKSGEPFEAQESCQSGEPHKSKEFPQSGALNKSTESYQSREHSDKRSGELARFRASPTTKEVEAEKNIDMPKTVHKDINPGERGLTDGPANDVPKALMNIQVEKKMRDSRDSCRVNCHSDKSDISNPSCALPIGQAAVASVCPGQAAAVSAQPGLVVHAQPGLAVHAKVQAVHGHAATVGSLNQKDPFLIPLPRVA